MTTLQLTVSDGRATLSIERVCPSPYGAWRLVALAADRCFGRGRWTVVHPGQWSVTRTEISPGLARVHNAANAVEESITLCRAIRPRLRLAA